MINIIGAAAAFLIGVVIAYLNYLLAKFMLKKHPNQFASITVVRQIFAVAYLVLIVLLEDKLPCDGVFLLVGATLGVTLPMFYFTTLLLKLNKKDDEKRGE